ncbi:DUF1289 domain-containing protein [Salinispirillum sp. LH 10-3-1]|uniref:DUF1289 domain-containing protein n=1 Tax=Salinispirillum sp. LH 10-3-1 TaxID=2952525 RepID=A0AB38YIF1_9GAMM
MGVIKGDGGTTKVPLSPTSASPCVGICSVTVGDTVCRGCFRTLDDIARWSSLNPDQLAERLARRRELLEESFTIYFELRDPELLLQQWHKYVNCPPHPQFPIEAWVQLLHLGASKIINVEAYGIRIKPEHGATTLRVLWRTWRDSLLDEALYS